MKRLLNGLILVFLIINTQVFAEDVTGFWKTIDDKTGKPQSIVAVYEYQGKYYGRMIETINDETGQIDNTIERPKNRAEGVKGHPYYSGLDFIWGLEKKGNRYTNGHIMDPHEGKIYGCEMWLKDGNLIVRGEVLVFGRNETWPPATDADFPAGFQKPDITKFVPQIPEVAEED